jgi:peptidoglycan/xylan/chitin deacetylase (PgdA/CDA1 family)
LPLEQIDGYDAAKLNTEIADEIIKEPVWELPNTQYSVALTFDDWGSDKIVTSVLDILKQNNIKATFFLRANGVINNPNLAKAIAEDGHDIANHTFSHVPVTSISPQALQEDIVKCHRVLTYAIQRKPEMFFRPPTFALDDTSIKVIQATGYKNIIMSYVSTHDWDSSKSTDLILSEVFRDTENGSIITMHIIDDSSVLKILQPTIDMLKAQGLTFVKLSDYIIPAE